MKFFNDHFYYLIAGTILMEIALFVFFLKFAKRQSLGETVLDGDDAPDGFFNVLMKEKWPHD